MAIVGINLLYQINEVLEKINSFKEKISVKQSEIQILEEKFSKEEDLFKQNQKEIQIQQKILEEFSLTQKKFLVIESEMRKEIASSVEKAINDFLTAGNIHTLVEKIIKNNPSATNTILAGEDISQSLKLKNTVPSNPGVLRVVFDKKTYNLDLLPLKEKLREKILISIFAK